MIATHTLDGGNPRFDLFELDHESWTILKIVRFNSLKRARMYAFGTKGAWALETYNPVRRVGGPGYPGGPEVTTEGYVGGNPCCGFVHKE